MSIKLIAVNDDRGLVTMLASGRHVTIDTASKDVVSVSQPTALTAADGWERSTSNTWPRAWSELAAAATSSLSVETKNGGSARNRTFRVPAFVQQAYPTIHKTITASEASAFLKSLTPSAQEYSETGAWLTRVIQKHELATGEVVTSEEPAEQEEPASGAPDNFEYDENNEYFGRGVDPDSTKIVNLYRLTQDGEWSDWSQDGEWLSIGEPTDDEILILLDQESAETAAEWIVGPEFRDNPDAVLELSLLDPEAWGLFTSAVAELDFEFLDRMFDIYDSQERSVNARKQVRSNGGKFAPKPKGPADHQATADMPKARLPEPLPLVEDVAGLIARYLADVETQRGGTPEAAPEGEEPLTSAVTSEEVKTTDARPLYMAIVDKIDTDAVLDVVALVPPPAKGGEVSVWKRDAGKWIIANEYLADLQGSTPPPVVELKDDKILAGVLAQVDKATAQGPAADETQDPNEVGAEVDNEGEPLTAAALAEFAALGFAMEDTSLIILNQDHLRKALRIASTDEEWSHVSKRAAALNRLDLVPVERRAARFATSGAGSELWGPFGELFSVTAAGGADRNRGNAETLRRYWTTGEGGAKIRWNTPGDWTRCHRYLSKYLGARSAGYCALRHREMTGVWPGDRRNVGR